MLIFAIHNSWLFKSISWFGKICKKCLCCRLRLEVFRCGLLAPVLQLQQLGAECYVKTRSLSDVAVFAFVLSILPFHKVSPTSIVVANCGDCRCVLNPDYFETDSVSI